MTPELRASNIASWQKLSDSVDRFPDDAWIGWKHLVSRLIEFGREQRLDTYFRAGQSMHDLLFSTAPQHGLASGDPKVRVTATPPETRTIAYEPGIPSIGADERLEYTLNFEDTKSTLHRFLKHLWTMTVPDALPPELRVSPVIRAPILTSP